MPRGTDVRLTRREALTAGATVATLAFVPSRASAADDLDAYVRYEMGRGHLPGLAVAVVRPDGSTWTRGYGSANLAHDRRASRDTEWMLASVSKTVTGVAVMQGIEDRLLGLDDDVADHVPFPVRNPEFPDDPITLRMLLTHTSTIADDWDALTRVYVEGDSPVALGSFLADYFTPGARWYDAERNFVSSHPGRRYRYCNVAVSLAAYVLETASGTPFDAWCMERIFVPLGMSGTSWHLEGLRRRDVAMPYRWVNAEDRFRALGHYGYPDYPDGQLRSNAAALSRFLIAFIRGGELDGVRILEEDTVATMRSSQVPEEIAGQGLIWYVLHRNGDRYWGHDGGDSGVATQMYFRPNDGVGVDHVGERRLAVGPRMAAQPDHGPPVRGRRHPPVEGPRPDRRAGSWARSAPRLAGDAPPGRPRVRDRDGPGRGREPHRIRDGLRPLLVRDQRFEREPVALDRVPPGDIADPQSIVPDELVVVAIHGLLVLVERAEPPALVEEVEVSLRLSPGAHVLLRGERLGSLVREVVADHGGRGLPEPRRLERGDERLAPMDLDPPSEERAGRRRRDGRRRHWRRALHTCRARPGRWLRPRGRAPARAEQADRGGEGQDDAARLPDAEHALLLRCRSGMKSRLVRIVFRRDDGEPRDDDGRGPETRTLNDPGGRGLFS